MAKAGLGSRRACEQLIADGGVTVNGMKISSPAERVVPGDDVVSYKGKTLSLPDKVYILAKRLAIELLDLPQHLRVFNVGRLDRDSEGLLLFTNDGDFADKIAHPRNTIEKEYHVHVVGDINGTVLKKMESGLRDQGEYLKVSKAALTKKRANGGVLKLVLTEGKKREIRRICKRVGLDVRRLIRVRIGDLKMGKFNPGFHRELTAEELSSLYKN